MGQDYHVRKIRSDNVAIGTHAKAKYITHLNVEQISMQADALNQIRQFIELLSLHADAIDSPHEVQANAESMEAAVGKKKLNRTRIENLIAKITTAVAGVTALANAIDAVQAVVTRLLT
jgi:hypothetical protein